MNVRIERIFEIFAFERIFGLNIRIRKTILYPNISEYCFSNFLKALLKFELETANLHSGAGSKVIS